MKIPLSWLKDYIDLDGLSVEEIARKLTLAGLEVEEIKYAGLPMPDNAASGMHASGRHEFKTSGIAWDREKIVVGEIREVMPHPNADRLTLLDLYDGQQDQVVLTGAPNIFHLKGMGKLPKPLKVAYAKEGATIYDGHADGLVLTTLKRAKIRGVESYSMACSEKELGISEDHEGIIILDEDAPVGMPLVDYMGDAVLDIAILPNMARNANVIGVARELAALTGRDLRGLKDLGGLEGFGAFVTNPLSLRPRLPTSQPAVVEYPGGFLLHTGLPNPGLSAGLRKFSAKWTRTDLPIIVHLMADRPEETQNMVRMLEEIENVMAVELGFAPLLADDILLLTLDMCLGELPLIFSLPGEQVLSLGPRLIQKGAEAISIAAPRGSQVTSQKAVVSGRLYGPSLFPQALDVVKNAAKIDLPIIGAGGVWSKENADAMLSVGALAVQVDAALWNPAFTL